MAVNIEVPGSKTLAPNMSTMTADSVAVTGGSVTGVALGTSSARTGTFVCNGATPVTVTNTTFAITDIVCVSLKTVGGTVGAIPAVQTVTGATGFTIAGTASDTSTYSYLLIATV